MTSSAASDEVEDGSEAGTEVLDSPPRRRGRPPKNPDGAIQETVIRRRTFTEGGEEQSPTFSALFDVGSATDSSKTPVKVRVSRVEPNEGVLGYIEDMEATDRDITERWGGSTFRLDAMNGRSQVVAVKTVKLSGDPIFQGAAAEAQWRRAHGLPPKHLEHAGGQQQMSASELLKLMDEREEKRRADQREWEEERRKRDEAADERRREREREHEVKLKNLEHEAQARRRQEDDERERRRLADLERGQQQSQQFMQTMLGIVTTSNQQSMQLLTSVQKGGAGGMMDGIKAVLAIKDAFGGGAGDGEPKDVLTSLIEHSGEILNGIANTATAAIREAKGGGVSGGVYSQPALPAAPGAVVQRPTTVAPGPTVAAATDGGFAIPADSPLVPKLQALIPKLVARGMDPTEALGRLIDGSIQALDGQQVGSTPAVPAGPVAFKVPGRVSFGA